MSLPRISINIPVLTHTDASVVLQSLEYIVYPRAFYEVILTTGNHLTKQRNKAIRESTGDIIYLLDNDSQVHPNALHIIAREFSKKNVVAVGGPSLPPKDGQTYFSQLVGFILETYFGAFRMRHKWSQQYMKKKASDYLFIGCNLALRKSAILEIGGFDERFQANDETELLRRLRDRGYGLKYCEQLYVRRHQRDSLIKLVQQFHHYGKGRMKHIIKNPKYDDMFLLAPVGFIFYGISLPFFHPMWYLLPIICYCLLAIATSGKAAWKYKRPDLLLSMNSLFPIIHISYAGGLMHELLIVIVSKMRLWKSEKEFQQKKVGRIAVRKISCSGNDDSHLSI